MEDEEGGGGEAEDEANEEGREGGDDEGGDTELRPLDPCSTSFHRLSWPLPLCSAAALGHPAQC